MHDWDDFGVPPQFFGNLHIFVRLKIGKWWESIGFWAILLSYFQTNHDQDMARNQNPGALMNIEIGGKWTFIPQKYGIIGVDPSPYGWFMIVLPTYPVVKRCVEKNNQHVLTDHQHWSDHANSQNTFINLARSWMCLQPFAFTN